MKLSNETVGIKEHSESDMGAPMCMDLKYLNGEDPGEYAQKQQNELASNARKYRAK